MNGNIINVNTGKNKRSSEINQCFNKYIELYHLIKNPILKKIILFLLLSYISYNKDMIDTLTKHADNLKTILELEGEEGQFEYLIDIGKEKRIFRTTRKD